jgi:Tol biopolymer transport system component
MRSEVDIRAIKEELDHVLASKVFLPAQRSQSFLRYIVERSLSGAPPKEYEIAVDVFGRGAEYDPAIDATVRVEAGRLRTRLREYYDFAGAADPILIEIPKGGYTATFILRETHLGSHATAPARVSPQSENGDQTAPLGLDGAGSTEAGKNGAEGTLESGKSSASEQSPTFRRTRRWVLLMVGAATIAVFIYRQSRPLPPPKVSGYVPVTHDGNLKSLVGTDGARLYLNEFSSAGPGIAQVSGSGGEVAHVQVPFPALSLLAVSPDGATLLVTDTVAQAAVRGSFWEVPVLGGSQRRLGEVGGQAAAWSPDGKMIVYADGRDLFLAKSDGSEPRKLVSAPDRALALAWSPDGSMIRFNVARPRELWEVSINGANLHPLLPAWRTPPNECCGQWTPDGKYFVFQSGDSIWARAEKGNLFSKAPGQPVQLTSGPMTFSSPLPSKDAKKLFVVGTLPRGELARYDAKSSHFVPFLSGISADSVNFSKDGQSVTYVSFPEGTLWRSKSDGSQRFQLTYPPLIAVLPSWSPDGQQIVFYGSSPSQRSKVYTVSADGGTPRELMPGDSQEQFDPTWSPDGTKIAFGGNVANGGSNIRILEVKTHQVSTLPGSDGLFAPRWSPDGRYVVAMPFDSHSLMLFDFASQTWEEIEKIRPALPNWSRSGDYVYFLHLPDLQWVMRVRIRDRKVERVADLKNFRQTGFYSIWLGIAPDDSPILLRDTGTQEVYALDWKVP